MATAINLAKRGLGFTNPNPLVGAVIVKGGSIIGEGWHKKYGEAHAERNAIRNAIERSGGDKQACQGAEIYVTLEPCCHTGKQPPCTDAIIVAGIKKVFIGSSDPNPLVAGKGISVLRNAGIEVTENVMQKECDKINKVFFHYITTKTPYVILKYAMSANGVISVRESIDKNISGAESHAHVHQTRSHVMAVMTGVSTVIDDDPMLNCRMENMEADEALCTDSKLHGAMRSVPRQPVRVVCDTNLRIPLNSRLVKTAKEFPLVVACSDVALNKNSELLQKCEKITAFGAQVLRLPCDNNGRIDLCELMKRLGDMGIDSVLCESGGVLSEAMLRLGLVQKVQVYVSPKFFGASCRKNSANVTSAVASNVLPDEDCAISANTAEKFISYFGSPSCVTQIGDDVLIEYEIDGTRASGTLNDKENA